MQSDHLQLWENCRQFFRENVPPQQFATWFEPITSVRLENGELYLQVPSPFFVEQLEERYPQLITAALRKVYGPGVKLNYYFYQVKNEPDTGVSIRSSEYSPVIRDTTLPAANPFAEPDNKPFNSQLNAKYNFENYCAGSSNAIARTIAESIANDPSNKTFNPLFIFGPTGVGKTHLIQAVGNRIKERNPRARVLYVTARFFQSQFTAANHKGQINNFFHFYHSIDTLIMDDVQDLGTGNKADTQNTFFHIFNQLHQNNRQIILSSDCAPSEMDGFEARLLSRFKWGVSAALEKPDMQLRRDVLMHKAKQDGLDLPTDVVEYIAENITDSLRELEGVVASLVAHAAVLNREISLDLARPIVANSIRRNRSQVNFEMVTAAVSEYFKLQPDVLFTKSRKREISDARQVLMYLAKKMAGMSLKSIGTKIGRTHATVHYACQALEERMSLDKELRDAIDAINRSIIG